MDSYWYVWFYLGYFFWTVEVPRSCVWCLRIEIQLIDEECRRERLGPCQECLETLVLALFAGDAWATQRLETYHRRLLRPFQGIIIFVLIHICNLGNGFNAYSISKSTEPLRKTTTWSVVPLNNYLPLTWMEKRALSEVIFKILSRKARGKSRDLEKCYLVPTGIGELSWTPSLTERLWWSNDEKK